MTEELKPCPFCGGEAKIEIDEDGSAFVTVEHEDCCYLDGIDTTQWFYAYDGKNPAQVAAEAWSRRAERTCRGRLCESSKEWVCEECGGSVQGAVFRPSIDGFTDAPVYCPNCGAKVVDDDY